MSDGAGGGKVQKPGLLGSLKEALAAASRDDTALAVPKPNSALPASATNDSKSDAPKPMPPPLPSSPAQVADTIPVKPLSAAEAAREARGITSVPGPDSDRHHEPDGANTTRYFRGTPGASKPQPTQSEQEARTQMVRGRQPLKRGQFVQDPVVGWLVIVGGPGLGAYRPVFEGNNTIGRGPGNRIPLDFGDDAISSEEQAYLRYDSADRAFLFVPNLSKTNVVQVNTKKPTGAVELSAMDVIVMGRTQLVFMPFCGAEFDWSEITETKD